MNLSILKYQACNIKEFSSFWSHFYDYKSEALYDLNINKAKFSKNDLQNLFFWKNGSRLSTLKQKSFERISDKIDVINKLKLHFDIEIFNKEFELKSAVIWKAYLLHVICPNKYPIFDQHVFRAYYFITQNKIQEISSNNRVKERVYFGEYVDFFNKLEKDGVSRKILDEALWAFGKFLKAPYGKEFRKS